jgi:uncharacterized protein
MTKIGIISDTHGSLSSKIFDVFKGVDLILHAGDIVGDDIITELRSISEVVAVHGNMDDHQTAQLFPRQIVLEKDGLRIHLSHKDGNHAEAVDVVVQGHTHLAEVHKKPGAIFINPGKASESVVIMDVDKGVILDIKIIFI